MNKLYNNPQKKQELSDPVDILIQKAPTSAQIIFKYLLNFVGSSLIFPSHETIARETGLGYATVGRNLNKLRQLGLIDWVYLHRKSNRYFFPSSVTRKSSLDRFKRFFKGMVPIILLTLLQSRMPDSDGPLKNLGDYFNIKQHTVYEKDRVLKIDGPSNMGNQSSKTSLPLGKRLHNAFSKIRKRPKPEHKPIYNKKRSMKQELLPFSNEQLLQLKSYPQESVTYANRKLASDLLSGKSISNQFSYLLGICKSHALEQKSPQKGQFKQSVIPKPYVRAPEWQPAQKRPGLNELNAELTECRRKLENREFGTVLFLREVTKTYLTNRIAQLEVEIQELEGKQ